MSSKTKIVVLHLKELIYTCIFAVLGILFLILLIIMFLPEKSSTPDSTDAGDGIYTPGKYTTSLILGNSAVDVEVVVDDNNINSIRLVNLDEAVTTMYPLMEPALNDLASQICARQSMEDISYSDDNKYTAQVLLEAISSALERAEKVPGSTGRSKPTRLTQGDETETESTAGTGNEAGTGTESQNDTKTRNTESNTSETETAPGTENGSVTENNNTVPIVQETGATLPISPDGTQTATENP